MSSNTGSGHIKRNRPPRVQIAYADPYDSERMVELPFVMGVMSDLSGNNPGVEKPELEERDFSSVTKATLDDKMKEFAPGVVMEVENKLPNAGGAKLGVELKFESMRDFEPAQIARQVPVLNELLLARMHLNNLRRYMSAKPQAAREVMKLLNDPKRLEVLAQQARASGLGDGTAGNVDAADADSDKTG